MRCEPSTYQPSGQLLSHCATEAGYPCGVSAMSSVNRLVGTGFASRYRLQPRDVFKGPVGRCKATTPSSLSLTSNTVTTNY